jgi:hypothetical protein
MLKIFPFSFRFKKRDMQSEADYIERYHTPLTKLIGDGPLSLARILPFDLKITEESIEFLKQYLDDIGKKYHLLKQAAERRQEHYDKFIVNQRTEDPGHTAARELLNYYQQEGYEILNYYSQIYNEIIDVLLAVDFDDHLTNNRKKDNRSKTKKKKEYTRNYTRRHEQKERKIYQQYQQNQLNEQYYNIGKKTLKQIDYDSTPKSVKEDLEIPIVPPSKNEWSIKYVIFVFFCTKYILRKSVITNESDIILLHYLDYHCELEPTHPMNIWFNSNNDPKCFIAFMQRVTNERLFMERITKIILSINSNMIDVLAANTKIKLFEDYIKSSNIRINYMTQLIEHEDIEKYAILDQQRIDVYGKMISDWIISLHQKFEQQCYELVQTYQLPKSLGFSKKVSQYHDTKIGILHALICLAFANRIREDAYILLLTPSADYIYQRKLSSGFGKLELYLRENKYDHHNRDSNLRFVNRPNIDYQKILTMIPIGIYHMLDKLIATGKHPFSFIHIDDIEIIHQDVIEYICTRLNTDRSLT